MKETKIHEWIIKRRSDKPNTRSLKLPKELAKKLKPGYYLFKVYKLESEE